MNIPILDLKRQYQLIKDGVELEVRKVLESGVFILGENVRCLEKKIASFCGAKYAVGVASGTDALKISLQSCGIGKGDEVITTPFTFIATAESIYSTGARIVFADIDPETYVLDPAEIERRINKKTRAILCVHLYGQPCDMHSIVRLARKYKLKLIEDCAQAIGAEYRGKKVGTFGDAGAFSFYPSKNLGAFGDGGMIIANSKGIFEKARIIRVHGSSTKYEHTIHGCNSRIDELQAVILLTKLKYLNRWNNARRKLAAYYNRGLAELEQRGIVSLPHEQEGTKHVFHLYVLRTKKRDALMRFLKSRGIGTAVHYPRPIHLQKAFKELGYRRRDFPHSESAAREIISLPLYPELRKKEVEYIISSIRKFFK